MTEKSFVKGAFVLAIAGVLSKILGAFYRIPFARIVGDEGVGIYNLAYPLYTLLLALSTAGIPLAVSKLIAECEEREEYATSRRIFRLALMVLTIIGISAAMALFVNADFVAENILKDKRASLCLKAIAPAMIFTCLMAVFRGYFQGLQQMVPTAVSQVIEQFVRVGTIFAALYILTPYGIEVVVGGASLGAAVGGCAAFIFLFGTMFWYRKKFPSSEGKTPAKIEKNSAIIHKVLYLAIPISIGALVLPVMQAIDAVMVLRRLEAAGFGHKEAVSLYGHLSGYAGPIINLPFIITTALSASLVPAIAEAMAAGRREEVSNNYRSAMLIAIIIVLPATVGLMTLATPICQLLYAQSAAGVALFWAAPTVLVVGLYQTSAGTLQGLGKVMIPMQALIIGAIVKIILTYYLTAMPILNIRGAALGTVIGFAVAAIYNVYHVSQNIGKEWFHFNDHLFKPLASVCSMGIIVVIGYKLMFTLSKSNGVATLLAIALGGGVYFIVLLAIGGIHTEEIRKLPKIGNALANLLIKLKLTRD